DNTTLRLFMNGTQIASKATTGAITNTTAPLRIGGNSVWGEYFSGLIDDVRVYNRALTTTELNTDMNQAVGSPPPDTTPPTVSVTAPAQGATVSGTVNVTANASDAVGVSNVQFKLDGANLGAADTTSPYAVTWDTRTATPGSHTLTAVARDLANNTTTSSAVTVTVAAAVPGLVAEYGFEETSGTTATDSSGTGNDGTITGATRTSAGRHGSALSFNGTSDWVTIPGSSSLALTTAFTLEAWVKSNGPGSVDQTVLTKEKPPYMSYQLYAMSSGGSLSSTWRDTNGSYGSDDGFFAPSSSPTPAATWTHLAATYDNTTLRLFMNGTQIASKATTGAITNTTAPLRIGGNSVWGEYFSGLIDDVRVYNRALTTTELNTDMNQAVGSPPVDTTPPTVSVTAPAQGALLSGTVSVTANASDAVGVSSVQFKLDGNDLGSADTTSPYVVTWDTSTATPGSHTLTAVARDLANNTTTSSPVTVTVNNSGSAGLVAAYGFEEGSGSTVIDASGVGNAGTISGATRTAAGRNGSALSFNGTSDWVTVAGSSSLALTNSFTLEAWVKINSANQAWQTIITKEKPPYMSYQLYATSSSASVASTWRDTDGTYQDTDGFYAPALNPTPVGTWTHLAATYDSTTLRLFMNGTQVASQPTTGAITNTTAPLRIGGNAMWGEYFNGTMDDVRIYNRALTTTELNTDMNTGVGP
ncbi:MAG: hypothetical protein QOG15_473, partial [Solirubrobacteraceae bacterium]|nr:hypothetical protein [Solirubrobacteraceae bacterium]